MEVTNKKQIIDENGQALVDYFTVGQSTHVVTDGPLAVAFSDALNKLYRREYDPINGMALESQQQDSVEAKRQWLAAKVRSYNFSNDGADVGMLFGVKESQATHSDLIDVVDTLATMSDQQQANSAIVLQEDTPATSEQLGIPSPKGPNTVAVAIEQFAKERGVRVYRSFEQFIRQNSF